jgi:hypothetical protein
MTKFQILTLSAIAIGLCVPKIAYAEGDAELIKNGLCAPSRWHHENAEGWKQWLLVHAERSGNTG